jgi:hypothetical protein
LAASPPSGSRFVFQESLSINSIDENNFVASLLADSHLFTDANPRRPNGEWVGPYIGLKHIGPTTRSVNSKVGWQWVDGTLLNASDPLSNLWFNVKIAGGQPDAQDGDYVGLFYNVTTSNVYTWGDVYNGSTFLPQYGGGPNNFLANSFVIERVPVPVPLMGGFAAFRWSRQLRRRRHLAERRVVSDGHKV